MGAPTTVGGRTVAAPTLGSVTPAGTTTIAQPGQVQAGTYGANVAGTAAQAAGQQATGLTQQVVGQAGTALQATAATDTTAMTGALAGNVIGSGDYGKNRIVPDIIKSINSRNAPFPPLFLQT